VPFNTTPHLPDFTRHVHCHYSIIEEIVEGFVEGYPKNELWVPLEYHQYKLDYGIVNSTSIGRILA